MAYTLPVLRFKGKRKRLREISYLKIITVAMMWSLLTVILPMQEYSFHIASKLAVIIFIERFLFVYSITIPFEIRDMKQELRYGVRTIPVIHGIKTSKRLGYVLLLLFSAVALYHQSLDSTYRTL